MYSGLGGQTVMARLVFTTVINYLSMARGGAVKQNFTE